MFVPSGEQSRHVGDFLSKSDAALVGLIVTVTGAYLKKPVTCRVRFFPDSGSGKEQGSQISGTPV